MNNVIDTIAVQNLLTLLCCIFGKYTLGHFPLLSGLGNSSKFRSRHWVIVISNRNRLQPITLFDVIVIVKDYIEKNSNVIVIIIEYIEKNLNVIDYIELTFKRENLICDVICCRLLDERFQNLRLQNVTNILNANRDKD